MKPKINKQFLKERERKSGNEIYVWADEVSGEGRIQQDGQGRVGNRVEAEVGIQWRYSVATQKWTAENRTRHCRYTGREVQLLQGNKTAPRGASRMSEVPTREP